MFAATTCSSVSHGSLREKRVRRGKTARTIARSSPVSLGRHPVAGDGLAARVQRARGR